MFSCFRMKEKPKSEDYLYIILPYFNYCGYSRRHQLFVEFIDRIKKEKNIRVIVSEAAEKGVQFDLHFRNDVFMHLRFETESRIWLKENLINMAIMQLPNDWKYVAWIDADITFINENWVEETIKTLNKYDVIQMFQTCINLGPEGEVIKTDRGFAYMYLRSGREYTKTYKYGFWHPGYAWACTRKAYVAMNGLIDWGILGSGDHHMALALIKKVQSSHPGGIHKEYKARLNEFEKSVRDLKLGFITGTILHHWHGRLEDRKYRERWDILVSNEYNPAIDIEKSPNGLIQLTRRGMRIQQPIHEYFIGRREDNMTLH